MISQAEIQTPEFEVKTYYFARFWPKTACAPIWIRQCSWFIKIGAFIVWRFLGSCVTTFLRSVFRHSWKEYLKHLAAVAWYRTHEVHTIIVYDWTLLSPLKNRWQQMGKWNREVLTEILCTGHSSRGRWSTNVGQCRITYCLFYCFL